MAGEDKIFPSDIPNELTEFADDDTVFADDLSASETKKAPGTLFMSMKGASFPTGRAGLDFYHTGLKTQFKYANSYWWALANYDTLELYLDTGSGADSTGKGFGSGSDACASFAYLLRLIPDGFKGNVNVNMAAGSYGEEVVLQGKIPKGAFNLNFIGSLAEEIAATALDSAVQGTTSTQGSITKTGAFTLTLSTTSDGAVVATDTTIDLDSVSGISEGDRIVFDPAGAGNGPEPHRIKSIAGNTVTIDGEFDVGHADETAVIVCSQADMLIYSSSNNEYRMIDWHTADTAYVAGVWTSAAPSANFAVYSQGTIFDYLYMMPSQVGVNIYNLKFNNAVSLLYPYSNLNAYRCCFTLSSGRTLKSDAGQAVATLYDSLITNSDQYGISSFGGDIITLQRSILNGGGNGSYGLFLPTGSNGFALDGTIIEGFTNGVYADAGSYINAWGGTTGYQRIRNNSSYGVYASNSTLTNVIYNGNGADTN